MTEEKNKDLCDEKSNPQIEIPQPKKIKVGYSEIHNRGVFATDDIESEELIERCPMVPLDFRIKYHNDPQIYNYLYTHKCDCEECKKHGGIFLMVLGYGMIYNHQDIPNTIWRFRHKEKVADVVATRAIKKGEEIFVSYGQEYFKFRKKIELDKKIDKKIEIKENESMPVEWREWIKQNLLRGVPPLKIKDILLSNNFDICLIEDVLGENI